MPTQTQDALKELNELLVQIRGIASDAIGAEHVSVMGRGRFTPESACKAIYALADAAHHIPEALIGEGAAFMLDGSQEATACAGATVFGDASPIEFRGRCGLIGACHTAR